jgi:hypothetical protein
MEFLLELLFDLFFGAFALEAARFVGVCFLYGLGAVFGRPYSFSDLWAAKYDRKDEYMMMIEKGGQRIAGFMVIGVIAAICFAM